MMIVMIRIIIDIIIIDIIIIIIIIKCLLQYNIDTCKNAFGTLTDTVKLFNNDVGHVHVPIWYNL